MPKSQEASDHGSSIHSNTNQASRGFGYLHLTYYSLFFLMEVAFATLSWYCYVRPRLLPAFDIIFDDTTVRSGFTTIFSLWQSIAVGLALQICSSIISRERAVRGELETNTLLSKITQPVSDFFLFGKTFKIALLAYPFMTILRIVGNSAITVSNGTGFEQFLSIGLISTFSLTANSTDITSKAYFERRLQSNMIVNLEQLYDSPSGYVSTRNFLIPLPTGEVGSIDKVSYDSDVVLFNYDCRWRAPDSYSGDTIMVENGTWIAKGGDSTTAETGIVEDGSSIIFLLPKETVFSGDSAYLFLGANATILPAFNSTSNNTWIDLSNLPTIFDHNGFTSPSTLSFRPLRAPLATLLICNPRLKFYSRTVLLRPVENRTEPDITIQSDADVPSPCNIHPQAARTLFTVLLNTTIMATDRVAVSSGLMNANWVSAKMLLGGIDGKDTVSFPPLDRKSINDNIDRFTLSALKAFTSGYQGPEPSLRSQPSVFSQSVQGQFTRRGLALRTGLPFAVLYTALFSVLGIVVAALVYSNSVPH